MPRSPRRATRLRAVVDDGAHHAVGLVRDMSTSGLFLEAALSGDGRFSVGRRLAVVPLLGELDGNRLPAEIARVGPRGVAIRFLGLDPDDRQRLRQILSGDNRPLMRTNRFAGIRGHVVEIPAGAPTVLLTDDEAQEPQLVAAPQPARLVAAPQRARLAPPPVPPETPAHATPMPDFSRAAVTAPAATAPVASSFVAAASMGTLTSPPLAISTLVAPASVTFGSHGTPAVTSKVALETHAALADMRAAVDDLENQLLELGRRHTVVLDENGRLKRQVIGLQARNSLLMRAQEDLTDAYEVIADMERAHDAIMRELQRLERARPRT